MPIHVTKDLKILGRSSQEHKTGKVKRLNITFSNERLSAEYFLAVQRSLTKINCDGAQSQENQMHTPRYLNLEFSLTLTFKERIGSVRNAAAMCSIV